MPTIPATFPIIDLADLRLGQVITADTYTRLVQRAHWLWAVHRARVNGWHWDYQATSTSDSANSIDDQPDPEDYSCIMTPQRVLSGDVVRVGVKAFIRDAEITVDIWRMEPGLDPENALAADSFTITNSAANSWQWIANTVDIDISDITVSGALVPILLKFSITSTDFTDPARAKSIVPFEAGIGDLADSDLP